MNPFIKHPREVGMSYLQHFGFAFYVQFKLLIALVCCFIHAFFPFLFTTTTSTIVHQLDAKIAHRTEEEPVQSGQDIT